MPWIISLLLLLSCGTPKQKTVPDKNQMTGEEYVQLSKDFLLQLQREEDATPLVDRYASLDMDNLINVLNTQEEKLAFWLNTYNAFVQYLLVGNPELFDDRSAFFTKDRFVIAGQKMSFDRLEHGIIRNSRIKYGLGYIKKWFPPKYERKLRIKNRDGRIHFALNCGAISCPPIAVYDHRRVNEQLDIIAARYLDEHTVIDGNKVTTSPLFSWFRGDFCGKKGIKKFLLGYNILNSTDDVDLRFGDYDWTLNTGNYIEL